MNKYLVGSTEKRGSRGSFCIRNPIIRRPRPSPRPGRRLGPPQVWNFSFLAFQGQTTSRKPSPGMRHPPVKTSRHLDMKIICFGQVSLPAEGFVFQGQSSRSRIPVVFAFRAGTKHAKAPAPASPVQGLPRGL